MYIYNFMLMSYQSQFAIQLKTKNHMQLPTNNVNFSICMYKELL